MKKKSLLAFLLAGVLALALTACGGSGGDTASEEAPDYLGKYNLLMIKMGPLVMTPDEYGYENCYMELKGGGTLTFFDGKDSEEEPYTVDGTAFSMEENGSTMKGTIQDGTVTLTLTASDLGGEGDAEAMTMFFALEGSDAVSKLQDEATAAGTMDEQLENMSQDDLLQFMEDYGYLFDSESE